MTRRTPRNPDTVIMLCPLCRKTTPVLIAELMAFAKAEYLRGLRESANILHAHADRRAASSSTQHDYWRTP